MHKYAFGTIQFKNSLQTLRPALKVYFKYMHKQAEFKLGPELNSHFKGALEPPQCRRRRWRSESPSDEGKKGQNASERASPVQSDLRSTIGNGEMECGAELKNPPSIYRS